MVHFRRLGWDGQGIVGRPSSCFRVAKSILSMFEPVVVVVHVETGNLEVWRSSGTLVKWWWL